MNEKEILNALNVIKTICENHKDCECCPFYHPSKDCMIRSGFPDEWRLVNEEKPIWRAFVY